ncbi:MAG TPA: carboxypeptidase-like regulatory domain-containing protein, partial [Balneolaceae bacterium]|nr:carboxypeptidase-like regulatory domain-containing protein [Balneolaceae bacterium]
MRSLRISIFVPLVILFLVPVTSVAQNRASVSGYVRDGRTGNTLIAANLKLADLQKGTTTDTSGYFSLTDLQADTYLLIVSYMGYQRFEKKVKLEKGEHLQLYIRLKPEGYLLDEVVVQSQRKNAYSISSAHIKAAFIQKTPTVFQADVFRSLQLRPGIKAASDFSSSLYIRGGSPDQTLIL